MEDILKILPSKRKINTIDHKKIIDIILELDKLNNITNNNILENIKIISKKHKYYQRSKKKICKVFYQDMLWPIWCKSKNPFNFHNNNSKK